MASDGAAATPAKVTPKKANLLDPYSIKHLLDETISDVLCFTLNPTPSEPPDSLCFRSCSVGTKVFVGLRAQTKLGEIQPKFV